MDAALTTVMFKGLMMPYTVYRAEPSFFFYCLLIAGCPWSTTRYTLISLDSLCFQNYTLA